MKIFFVALIVSFYSDIGSAQSLCASLFHPQKGTIVYRTNSTLKRLDLAQKANETADRLFGEFSRGKTVQEGLSHRDQTSIPEFKSPVAHILLTFEHILRSVEQERDSLDSYYTKISLTEFFDITQKLNDHIKEGNKILGKEKFEYKETIFFAYRSSLLFIFLKSYDLQKINPDAYVSISKDKFLDFIENSKTYEEALDYSKKVDNEITKNFVMLNDVLGDPLTTFYFMRGMPTLATINQGAAKGAIFLSVSEKLANIHNQKNYPPYFLTYHDVVHAYTVTKNKNKILEQLEIKKPTPNDYIKIHSEIQKFLEQFFKFESSVPTDQKDLFHALYNSLTHDFVENLYHHPVRLKKIIEDYDKFMEFRKITIDRALRIHQEAKNRKLSIEEIETMESFFDQLIAKNMKLIR